MRPDRRIPERFRFWQGQALDSRDLNDIATLSALMKCWHNRTLHNAFGVAEGFAVRDPGDGSLVIYPGTAYDISGCPLVLHRQRSIRAPLFDDGEPRPQLLVLTRATDRRKGACCGTGSGPLQELELTWVAAASYAPAMGVALAEVEPDDTDLVIHPSPFPRVRAERQPLIGSGATVAGETDWQFWRDQRQSGLWGVQVTVDTRATGFSETPCYFARLQQTTPSSLGWFSPYWERIINPGATRFTFSLWLHFPPRTEFLLFESSSRQVWPLQHTLQTIARRELSVCWLGIQSDHRPVSANGDTEGGGNVVV